MPRKGKQKSELELLREEVAELRTQQSESESERHRESEEPAPAEPLAAAERDAAKEEWQETISELEEALGEFAGRAGKEITQRPIMAVIGAFLLGLLVGRLFSR